MAVEREQLIRTAEKYVSKGRIDAAIREYRKVLTDNPKDVSTLNRLGDLYARVQQFDEAVDLFRQIAEGYTEDGFFVKAIAIYKKILKLDPTRLDSYEQLADLYHRQGLVNEARSQYQVLADYYLKHGNTASAVAIYERMAELEPGNPSYPAKLAELYTAQKQIPKAMGAYRTIAELMLSAGHAQEATQVYLRALDVDASDLEFITAAVLRLKEAGHVGEAAKLLLRARDLNPEAAQVARLAGMSDRPAPAEEAAVAPSPAPAATPPAPPPVIPEPPLPPAASAPPLSAPPVEAPQELEIEGEELVLDLDAELAAEAPMASAAEPPPGAELEAGELEAVELEVELDEELSFDVAPSDHPELSDLAVVSSLEEDEAAAPSPRPVAPGKPVVGFDGEVELDLGQVFTLDLEDEEPSPSQVQPPEDMLDGRIGSAFRREGDEEEEAAPPPAGEAEEGVAFELGFGDQGWELETEVPVESEPPPEPVPELPAAPDPLAHDGLAGAGEVFQELTPSEVVLDLDVLERTAAELTVPPVPPPDADNLVAEAQVLAKYGMADKAAERLEEALRLVPDHLEACELLFRIQLERRATNKMLALARRIETLALGQERPEVWQRTRERLEEAGFHVGGLAPAAERPSAPRPGARIDRLLEDLLGGTAPRRKKRPAPPTTTEPAPSAEPPLPAESPAASPAAAAESPDDITLHGIFDEVSVGDEPEPFAALGGGEAPAPPPGDAPLDDAAMSWLETVEEGASAGAQGPGLYQEEDDFFDLAAELEEELSQEELMGSGTDLEAPREQSLEEIVEGFKRGVAENLSQEDFDTHFNLGIAYREMGLLDEAIGEFQVAAKSPDRLVECCSMLGLCFLEKGLPELAVKWYQRGLKAPAVSEEESLGLLYDMGNAYLALDDREAAHKTFVEVYGINSNYRDVVARLEELR
jgi:tetratricopeptide (TPR) repeat protein